MRFTNAFFQLASGFGRRILFWNTTEHVPTILELAAAGPHDRILGIVGGADQLFSLFCLDPAPFEVVGIDRSPAQLELAEFKRRLVGLLEFDEYRRFGMLAMSRGEREAIRAKAGGPKSMSKARLIRDDGASPLMRIPTEIPWHESREDYDRVRRHLSRLSLLRANLCVPGEFSSLAPASFDLVYLSNAPRWSYSLAHLVGESLGGAGEEAQPANGIFETMDRYLRPEGRHLFLMNVAGRAAASRDKFRNRLRVRGEEARRAHDVTGGLSMVYCLARKGARIRRYQPLLGLL